MLENETPIERGSIGEPEPSRPRMPDGYGVPTGTDGMFQWTQARTVLQEAHNYWISTTIPDGRPHAVPVWGAWIEDKFYCDGSPKTRWARNIMHNPAIVVSVEREGIAVMVHGTLVDENPNPESAQAIKESFNARYSYAPDIETGIWTMKPIVAFAWDESLKAATRWRFPDA